jgi:hypothetical protein
VVSVTVVGVSTDVESLWTCSCLQVSAQAAQSQDGLQEANAKMNKKIAIICFIKTF